MLSTHQLVSNLCRWLYSHGRKEDAVQVLSDLLSATDDSSEVQTIVSEMEAAILLEQNQPKLSIMGLLRDKSDIKKARRLVLCFMIYFMQMFTGINVIAFYGTSNALERDFREALR